jgi:hypothetical protein
MLEAVRVRVYVAGRRWQVFVFLEFGVFLREHLLSLLYALLALPFAVEIVPEREAATTILVWPSFRAAL